MAKSRIKLKGDEYIRQLHNAISKLTKRAYSTDEHLTTGIWNIEKKYEDKY